MFYLQYLFMYLPQQRQIHLTLKYTYLFILFLYFQFLQFFNETVTCLVEPFHEAIFFEKFITKFATAEGFISPWK